MIKLLGSPFGLFGSVLMGEKWIKWAVVSFNSVWKKAQTEQFVSPVLFPRNRSVIHDSCVTRNEEISFENLHALIRVFVSFFGASFRL